MQIKKDLPRSHPCFLETCVPRTLCGDSAIATSSGTIFTGVPSVQYLAASVSLDLALGSRKFVTLARQTDLRIVATIYSL